MIAFLLSEVAFFGTLIVTYLIFLGKDAPGGPTPAVLSLPLVICTTICLLSSSGTIHVAERSLHAGSRRGFFLWWAVTISLGVLFLLGTAYEWYGLIIRDGLTISRNLFGTTYYTLVGFHAIHVTVGVVAHDRSSWAWPRSTSDHGEASWPPSRWRPGTGTLWMAFGWLCSRSFTWWGGEPPKTTEPYTTPALGAPAGSETIEAPRPTIAPFVLVAGLSFAAAGVAFDTAVLLVVGAAIFHGGLGGGIGQLLPGRGHVRVEAVEPLPRPVTAAPGTVERLAAGTPGYRAQLPTRMHPISSGVWGGLVGGALMLIPALAYGLLSAHHSVWYPVNLLAGMVLPGVAAMNLNEFHASLFIAGVVIHLAMSLAIGLMLGVLLPTLPPVPKALAWGGLLMPLLWTAVSFVLMGFVNPLLAKGVDWPWFIFSQFVFGVAAAAVIANTSKFGPVASGLMGGAAGGLFMAVPALLWSLSTGRGVWYPVNLLAGMVVPGMPSGEAALRQYHSEWFVPALLIHAGLSAAFGLAYALALPKLRPIPGPFVWGALLLPLLWTGASYGLMGVVNPTLQAGVEWPWFIVSQFVFGVAAATVVARSEKIEIPPVGTGPQCRPVRPPAKRRFGRDSIPPPRRRTLHRPRFLALLVLTAAGCDLPGRPKAADRPVAPDQVLGFTALYGQNCAGCHGADGKLGPAPPLNDPLFRAVVPAETVEEVVAAGRPGTLMPAFAREQGGPLTAPQVAVLVNEVKGIPYKGIENREGGSTRFEVVRDPEGAAPVWGPPGPAPKGRCPPRTRRQGRGRATPPPAARTGSAAACGLLPRRPRAGRVERRPCRPQDQRPGVPGPHERSGPAAHRHHRAAGPRNAGLRPPRQGSVDPGGRHEPGRPPVALETGRLDRRRRPAGATKPPRNQPLNST